MLLPKLSPSSKPNLARRHRNKLLVSRLVKQLKWMLAVALILGVMFVSRSYFPPISRWLGQLFSSQPVQTINITPAIPLNLYFTNIAPAISFSSSSSAQLETIIDQLKLFVSTQSSEEYLLDQEGNLKTGSVSANINLIINSKPDSSILRQAFKTLNITGYFFHVKEGYLYQSSLFLRPLDLPDMIISAIMSETEVKRKLSFMKQIISAKTNPKLIDLRFKNPIVY